MSRNIKNFVKVEVCDSIDNRNTKQCYLRSAADFQNYCRDVAGIGTAAFRVSEDPRGVIQGYERHLEERGLSPNSIHTYLAPVCGAFGVSIRDIDKPKRSAASVTRSERSVSGEKVFNHQGAVEAVQTRYERSVGLQSAIGIRRSELSRLRGRDLVRDSSGWLCVQVERGKGGKHQLNRVLPQDEKAVRAVFAGVSPNERVFSYSELNNKIDYHGMRSLAAQKAYSYYESRLAADPGYRQKLNAEMLARFDSEHPERTPQNVKHRAAFIEQLNGPAEYRLRGDVRARAEELGRPVVLDRTAVLATSVFHLAHWRADVTVSAYLSK